MVVPFLGRCVDEWVVRLEAEDGDHRGVSDEQQVTHADQHLRHLHALVGLAGLALQVGQFVAAHGVGAGGQCGTNPGAVVSDQRDELPEVAQLGDPDPPTQLAQLRPMISSSDVRLAGERVRSGISGVGITRVGETGSGAIGGSVHLNNEFNLRNRHEKF